MWIFLWNPILFFIRPSPCVNEWSKLLTEDEEKDGHSLSVALWGDRWILFVIIRPKVTVRRRSFIRGESQVQLQLPSFPALWTVSEWAPHACIRILEGNVTAGQRHLANSTLSFFVPFVPLCLSFNFFFFRILIFALPALAAWREDARSVGLFAGLGFYSTVAQHGEIGQGRAILKKHFWWKCMRFCGGYRWTKKSSLPPPFIPQQMWHPLKIPTL